MSLTISARKLIESTLPITRTDNDIELLLSRSVQKINTILDMFVASQLPVHILRGTEPNLRYGFAIRNHISNGEEMLNCPALQSNAEAGNKVPPQLYNEIPQRYDALRVESDTAHAHGLDSRKCIHLASRKQIGDAILRFEDRSILHK